MAHTISVSDEVYDELVRRSRRLDLPIGRVVAIPEDDSKNIETEQKLESKDNEGEFVFREEFEKLSSRFDEVIRFYDEDFREAGKELESMRGKLENIRFCPNCEHVLYLHVQNHTIHSTPEFYEYSKKVGSVYGEGGCCHLECPRCGYYVGLKKPKWWQYKDGEKKVLDLRNAEGRGEDLAGQDNGSP